MPLYLYNDKKFLYLPKIFFQRIANYGILTRCFTGHPVEHNSHMYRCWNCLEHRNNIVLDAISRQPSRLYSNELLRVFYFCEWNRRVLYLRINLHNIIYMLSLTTIIVLKGPPLRFELILKSDLFHVQEIGRLFW